jgi:hypothetical protein
MSSGSIAADDDGEDSDSKNGYLADIPEDNVWTRRFVSLVAFTIGFLLFIAYLLLRGGVPL